MFSIHDTPSRLCDGISRREMLRVGGLSTLGLTLPGLLQGQALASTSGVASPCFGKAKNIIFLWLQGGPPQHETFDPKPEAPIEIRGPFKPISTNVPGIQFSELLPRTSAIADKLAVIRSVSTYDNNHDISGYWILTGQRYLGATARAIKPQDWPYFGSLIKMKKPSETMPPFTTVWLPDWMRLNDNVTPAGQTCGFLSKQWEPERVIFDPYQEHPRFEGFGLPQDVPSMRLSRRETLLKQVDRHFNEIDRGLQGPAVSDTYDYFTKEAFGLLSSGRARQAFDLEQESAHTRDRYGRNPWGRCTLLARRLVEAGVRLVHVNWCREPGDTAVDNPMWDTHDQNEDRLKDVLCPQFDYTFTALMEDLEQRGLLSETLVVVAGEFGRTPKINKSGGRDHWGYVFSLALAGAGISGGQVYGASDRNGAYPIANRCEPQHITATMFHLLGIPHESTFRDREGREHPLTKGEPLHTLLGTEPATTARTTPGGDLEHAVAFDPALMIDGQFENDDPLERVEDRIPFRAWQATPLSGAKPGDGFEIQRVDDVSKSLSGRRHVVMGYGRASGKGAGTVKQGYKAILTQRLNSPRAGLFTLSAKVAASGSSEQYYRDVFQKHFTVRLVLFGYKDLEKNVYDVKEYASIPVIPAFSANGTPPKYERFECSRKLRGQDDNAHEISMGIGVSLIIEKTSPGTLDLSSGALQLLIDDFVVDFNARPRDDTVKI